jgi:hypothetical protein
LAREIFTDGPVAGLKEPTEQLLVAFEHVAVDLDELCVPICHHRIAQSMIPVM